MDAQSVPPNQAKLSRFPKLTKKSIIFILAVAILILLIPLIFLSSKKQITPEPEVPQAKTWEIILSFDNKTETLSLKKLSVLNQEILADFRSAAYSPYELVVSDKDERALFRTKVNIAEQILYNIWSTATDSANLASPPEVVETILYIPFKPEASKIQITKNYSTVLQINITPETAFNIIPEVFAQTVPNNCGGMQVVFVSDGYTSEVVFRQDVETLKNSISTVAPYSSNLNIFSFQTLYNTTSLGCLNGIVQCLNNSSTIRQVVRRQFPNASKIVVVINNPNAASVDNGLFGAVQDIGGDISVFTKRQDYPQQFIPTFIHEFLGHSVGLLYERYVAPPNWYAGTLRSVPYKSNCTENPQGEAFWRGAGSTGAYQGCSSNYLYAPSPRNCPNSQDGTTESVMSAGGCNAKIGFDSVEQTWIRQRVIPLYQTSCQQPANTPQPTVPIATSTPLTPGPQITPGPGTYDGRLGGIVFIDSNRNGRYDFETGEPRSIAAANVLFLDTEGRTERDVATNPGYPLNWSFLVKQGTTVTLTLIPPSGYEVTTMDGTGRNPQYLAQNKISIPILTPYLEDYNHSFGIAPLPGVTIPANAPVPTVPITSSKSSGASTSSPTTSQASTASRVYTCEEVPSTGGNGSQVQIKTLECN